MSRRYCATAGAAAVRRHRRALPAAVLPPAGAKTVAGWPEASVAHEIPRLDIPLVDALWLIVGRRAALVGVTMWCSLRCSQLPSPSTKEAAQEPPGRRLQCTHTGSARLVSWWCSVAACGCTKSIGVLTSRARRQRQRVAAPPVAPPQEAQSQRCLRVAPPRLPAACRDAAPGPAPADGHHSDLRGR